MAAVSTALRGEDGLGVTRQVLAAALASNREAAFLEGMRSWPEIELIRRKAPCSVVAFLAPGDCAGTGWLPGAGRTTTQTPSMPETSGRSITGPPSPSPWPPRTS